jgi:hypothetical protein
MVRRAGEIVPEFAVFVSASSSWETRACSLELREGLYELILAAEQVWVDPFGRTVGMAVSSIAFD